MRNQSWGAQPDEPVERILFETLLATDALLAERLTRMEHEMANLTEEIANLQADDVAVIQALNKLAQQIADLTAAGAPPEQIAQLEQIHQDFLAALNPTVPATKPAVASQANLKAAGVVNPNDPRAGVVTGEGVKAAKPVAPPAAPKDPNAK